MLVVGGKKYEVPGHAVIGPGEYAWAKLNRGDFTARKTTWPRQFVWHTTKGIAKQFVVEEPGPGGKDRSVADYWNSSPDHSAAQLVIDDDGSIVQLAEDLLTVAAYQATTCNDWSNGIEVFQRPDGGIHRASLNAVRALAPVLARALRVPHQHHNGRYVEGKIVERLKRGGPDVVGHFGHRDQAWKFPTQLDAAGRAKYPDGYSNRGFGDPGDLVMHEIEASGSEGFDFGRSEELAAWIRRQKHLLRLGTKQKVIVDGVCGRVTMDAMAELGFADGRAVDKAIELTMFAEKTTDELLGR